MRVDSRPAIVGWQEKGAEELPGFLGNLLPLCCNRPPRRSTCGPSCCPLSCTRGQPGEDSGDNDSNGGGGGGGRDNGDGGDDNSKWRWWFLSHRVTW